MYVDNAWHDVALGEGGKDEGFKSWRPSLRWTVSM
jgi:hypothetical protein